MVAVIEDDSAISQTSSVQLCQALTRKGVGARDNIVVLCPIPPSVRVVGMVGRHPHFGWVCHLLVWALPDLRLMTDGCVEDRKERLPLLPTLIVRFG